MTDRDGEDQAFVDAISEWPDIDDGPPTLAGFLLARITEDEAVARGAGSGTATSPLVEHDEWQGLVVASSARVLAECEAKRWLVETFRPIDSVRYNDPEILRRVALIYADHPDYRDEWRP